MTHRTRTVRPYLQRLATRIGSLALVAWVVLLSQPALADLPKVMTPGDADDGDFISMFRYFIKAGVNVLVLALGAFALIRVAGGGLTKWDDYRKGRADLGDMKEYFVGGSIVVVIVVALLTTANTML